MATKVDYTLATAIHFFFGFAGVIFPFLIGILLGSVPTGMGGAIGFTGIFSWYFYEKQMIDRRTGEDSAVTSGDLAEFAAGVVFSQMVIVFILLLFILI